MARRFLAVGALGSLTFVLGAAALVACGSSGDDDDVVDDAGGDTGDVTGDGASGGGDAGDASHKDGGADAGKDGSPSGDATTGDAGDATTGDGGDAGGDATTGPDAGADAGDSGGDATTGPADSGVEGGPEAGPDAGPTSYVHFYGRFDTTDTVTDNDTGATVTATPSAPIFDWSGSSIVTDFIGTGIAVKLTHYQYDQMRGHEELEVVVDGTDYGPLVITHEATFNDQTAYSYDVKTGLADKQHHLELYKRTEAIYGYFQFGGFVNASTGSADYAPVATVDPYPRKIEFIGDSITAGYGVLGSYQCDDDSSVNDGYASYPGFTARALGASFVSIAYSGKGVYQDLNGNTTASDPGSPEMPALYTRTVENFPTSSYNFATQVQAVVINLGTNDYAVEPGHTQGQDPAGFVPAYEGLVATVRSHYPSAYILMIDGPLINDGYPFTGAYTQLKTDLDTVVAHFAAKGDTNMGDLEVPTQGTCTATTCGCDSHPNVAEDQALAANNIAPALKTALHW